MRIASFAALIAGILGLAAAAAADRTYGLAGGSWRCVTFEGNVHDEFFEQEGPHELSSATSLFGTSGPGQTTLYLRFARDGRWKLSERGRTVATAPEWTHAQWELDGSPEVTSQGLPMRSVLTDLGMPLAFRRDVQVRDGGSWHTLSGETCRRIGQ